jgi:hypothetical protein
MRLRSKAAPTSGDQVAPPVPVPRRSHVGEAFRQEAARVPEGRARVVQRYGAFAAAIKFAPSTSRCTFRSRMATSPTPMLGSD